MKDRRSGRLVLNHPVTLKYLESKKAGADEIEKTAIEQFGEDAVTYDKKVDLDYAGPKLGNTVARPGRAVSPKKLEDINPEKFYNADRIPIEELENSPFESADDLKNEKTKLEIYEKRTKLAERLGLLIQADIHEDLIEKYFSILRDGILGKSHILSVNICTQFGVNDDPEKIATVKNFLDEANKSALMRVRSLLLEYLDDKLRLG